MFAVEEARSRLKERVHREFHEKGIARIRRSIHETEERIDEIMRLIDDIDEDCSDALAQIEAVDQLLTTIIEERNGHAG